MTAHFVTPFIHDNCTTTIIVSLDELVCVTQHEIYVEFSSDQRWRHIRELQQLA